MTSLKSSKKFKLSFKQSDKRGFIHKLIEGSFSSCLIIKSNKNTIRANHYHKKDSHYCYVMSGKIVYYYKKLKEKKVKKFTVNKGELFYTPSLEEHLMYFPKKTCFITISPKKRSKFDYEKDLVRVNMLEYSELKNLKVK